MDLTCIIVLEPPYQTYSSVGQAGFHCRLSAHEPPLEFIVSMGLAQARPNYNIDMYPGADPEFSEG